MTLDEAEEHCRALEGRSRQVRTPCGEGTMIWHVWGAGPPVVLLHGGSGSWRHWILNVPDLARDSLVVAPDLPGLGLSDLAPPPRSPDSLAAIVAQGLDDILGRETACDLVGFSFGGLLAGHVAVLRADGVAALTLVAPGGLGNIRMPFSLEKVRGKSGAERYAAHRANLARMMIADPARIDALALAVQDWNSDHARVDSRPLGQGTSLLTALGQVHGPVNAVYGDRDQTMPDGPAAAEAILRGVQPGVDFRVVPGAGHWLSYEAAETFNPMLRDMLARSRSPAAVGTPV